MKKIQARYIRGSESDSAIGLPEVRCPVCDRRVCQKDVCPQYEDGTDRLIELCESCVDDFERETCALIESDVLSRDLFAMLWAWTAENLSRNYRRWLRETA